MTPPLPVSPNEPVTWRLIQARGAEAVSFLQGQLSCDVTMVTSGHGVDGLLLTPSGEVITSLHVRAHVEGVDIVVRSELSAVATSALGRFLMRTACEFLDGGETAGPFSTVGEQVDRGEPGPNEFAARLAAHAYGQDFVDSHVSFDKGCFTGQELVGRLDARGANVPFRLARVTGDDVALMASVVASAGPSGERARQGLTTVVADQDVSALALVHRSLVGESATVVIDGVTIELLHDQGRRAR